MCEKRTDNLISIIIPIYNVEDYIEKCIDSVVAQTYKNIEIILVDDGSTDKSGEICDKYVKYDPRIKVIHKLNGGSVSARKAGLHIAEGKYIGFVDSDDYIDENMFEELFNKIYETKADFVHSGFYVEKGEASSVVLNFSDECFEVCDNRVEFLKRYVFGSDIKFMHPSIWSKLFTRELIEKCFNEVPDTQSYGEDLLNLVWCVMNANRIATVNGIYYHYVYRASSIVNSNVKRILREVNLHSCLIDVLEKLKIREECQYLLDGRLYGQVAEALSVACSNDELHIPRYYIKDINELIGKKVVIYGAGNVGIDIYYQLCKYESCDIVGIVDRNYKMIEQKYIKIKSVEELSNMNYDVLLIGVKYKSVADSIIESLRQIGVNSDHIVWKKPYNIFESSDNLTI